LLLFTRKLNLINKNKEGKNYAHWASYSAK